MCPINIMKMTWPLLLIPDAIWMNAISKELMLWNISKTINHVSQERWVIRCPISTSLREVIGHLYLGVSLSSTAGTNNVYPRQYSTDHRFIAHQSTSSIVMWSVWDMVGCEVSNGGVHTFMCHITSPCIDCLFCVVVRHILRRGL